MKDRRKTKVRFYLEPNGTAGTLDVLAVFPDERRTDGGETLITCYSHFGQHSECVDGYLENLEKAAPEQYETLRRELENTVGYVLDVLD